MRPGPAGSDTIRVRRVLRMGTELVPGGTPGPGVRIAARGGGIAIRSATSSCGMRPEGMGDHGSDRGGHRRPVHPIEGGPEGGSGVGLALKAEGRSVTLRIRSEPRAGDERRPYFVVGAGEADGSFRVSYKPSGLPYAAR